MLYTRSFSLLLFIAFATQIGAQKSTPAATSKVDNWKTEVIKSLEAKKKNAQEMVDMVFSFSELGFQETETSAYLIRILETNGFTVEKGIAGMPTAWMAKWAAAPSTTP